MKSANELFESAAHTLLFDADLARAGALMGDAARTSAREAAAEVAASVNVDNIAAAVEERAGVRRAFDKLIETYPEIRSDPDMAVLADRYVNAHVANGASVPDALRQAGDQLGEKFRLGRYKDAGRASRNGKRDSGQASEDGPIEEEDYGSVISTMRRGRPGSSAI